MCIRLLGQASLAAALLLSVGVSVFAGTTETFTFEAESYSGSRDREYSVYRPDHLGTPAPMVMVLHGCRQTEDDVLQDWGLTAAADRYGFVLVTPFITSYDGLRNPNCWGFWFDHHQHEGRGEPEDLHRIAQDVEERVAIDPARRYIAGLSSGGAMAVVAAVTHNEYWAAAASAAGLPYGEDATSVSFQCPGTASFHALSRVVGDMRDELDDPYPIPLMVIQNERDCTVIEQAGLNLRDAHLAVFGSGAPQASASSVPCTPFFVENHGCRHETFTTDGDPGSRSVVETLFYAGPLATPNSQDTDHGHYWIGGEDGNNGKWSLRHGPSLPDITWDFFARHPRVPAGPAGPRITLLGPDPLPLEVGQAFVDPGATATDPEDGNLPVSADCTSVDTTRAGRYTCTYSATDSDGNMVSVTREVDITDPNACVEVSASPRTHVTTGRAVVFSWFFFHRALASGDRRDIGFAWDDWSRVTLYEDEERQWVTQPREGCPQ
ncbi:extracellular catalytic domain type 1 short-chain-length polyhydroxyalkanoate depolymerase [Halomonas cerina]|uniref:Poly(Hydroxyalkanoate) depolymerase family esterase n=1 Tax=Halomonas cerina TaxID=447424 RepID=A0A839V9W8_9GAMM|nr:PHB depolymerase family esterase [Halomonas cerina]MBB3190705.1 poly(hydroxyalkanoate) depolymerase family esterase [Halomonas cerina]